MEKTIILILFVLTYLLLLLMPKKRAYIALITAVIFILLGLIPAFGINSFNLIQAIDLNVIFMIAGTMLVVLYFIDSNAAAALTDFIVDKVPTVKWAIIALALFSGLISAFVDNVATVLIVAPIALDIAKRLKISPVPIIISITVSANLQGFATLVGDTTSIMLGSLAHMTFADFFFLENRIGPFFVVQIGALSTLIVLLILFRKLNQPLHLTEKTIIKDMMPSYFLIGIIVLLILASFIPNKPALTNGYITLGVGLIATVYDYLKHKDLNRIRAIYKEVDYTTLLLLIGLFMVIATLSEVGLIEDIASIFVSVGGDNPFILFTMAVWLSVILSAFIDNIPYVATMLPVMAALSTSLNINPYLLYFGLLAGATLGGNLSPIGASANITGIGILRSEGYTVSFKDFIKVAWPMTITAVTVAYLLIWLLWK